jgi:hypothetical protein
MAEHVDSYLDDEPNSGKYKLMTRGGLLGTKVEGMAVDEENKDGSVMTKTYQAMEILISIPKLHKIVQLKQFIR